jgi:hypothetical protein
MPATKQELEEQLAASQEELSQIKKVLGHLKISEPTTQYKEKKFKKFNGEGDVMEWTTEVLKYVSTRFQSDAVRIDFIIDHLEGKAKREIKYRLMDVSTTADNLVAMLIDTFGDRDQVIKLQQTFYSRMQQPGESVEDYAYALTDLVVKMRNAGVKLAYTKDQILKERFADGVEDVNLRRELCRLNLEAPTLKFHELRKRALRWEDCARKEDRTQKTKFASLPVIFQAVLVSAMMVASTGILIPVLVLMTVAVPLVTVSPPKLCS